MTRIVLPTADGGLLPHVLRGEPWPVLPPARPFNRVVLSAAHVVSDGLGIAEAMDTAQRGMGLAWP